MSDEEAKIRLLMEMRRLGITDTTLLGAFERVPRENFVLPILCEHAYENAALPITHEQTISQPFVVAFMTQALALGPRMKVLEVGTGSGYQTAILSHLCRRVYSIERIQPLLKTAEQRLKDLDIHNVTTKTGDGYLGWPEQAPFDRILVTAAAAKIPDQLKMQLAVGGVMVIPIGEEEQEVIRIRRDDAAFHEERLLRVKFVPLLPGIAKKA